MGSTNITTMARRPFPITFPVRTFGPWALAGLWNEWTDPETGEILNTFSIVTTEGNPMMAEIHNNPKMAGPRMPVILPDGLEDAWLEPYRDELDQKQLEELLRPYPESELAAHTVGKLRGKDAVDNNGPCDL